MLVNMEAHTLQYIGAVLAMVVGTVGFFKPNAMKDLLGLTYSNAVGKIEIRVLFGSFLVCLPLVAIVMGQAQFFVFYGVAGVSAAIIKSVFAFIDHCPFKAIIGGIIVDVVLAALLLSSLYL